MSTVHVPSQKKNTEITGFMCVADILIVDVSYYLLTILDFPTTLQRYYLLFTKSEQHFLTYFSTL